MKRIIVCAMVILLVCLPLGACADQKPTLNIFNWGEYIANGTDGAMDVIAEFEKQFNVKVNYQTFDDNESMYTKLKASPSSYDVIIPSDYMIAQLIREDMLEKLDFGNIPNFEDVRPDLKNPVYDPTQEYSVPYMWGTVGIIYDKEQVTKPVDSWDILWDADYKGEILMFNNPRDAFGIALKKLGYSFNTTDETEIRAAADELKKQRDVIQAYVMDQIFDKMEAGEALIAPYYSGDAIMMMEANESLAFAVPKEGTNRFVDAACIPKGAKNKALAEQFINYLAKAEVSRANSEFIGYSTPMTSAMELLSDDLKNNEIAYPSAQWLQDNTETFLVLPQETLNLYASLWTEIKK